MDFYWYRKYKIDSKSFILMYLGNPNCNSFIWNSFMIPYPLTLGTPKAPWSLQKSDNYLIIEYVKKIQFSISFSGRGGHKIS